MSDGPQPPQPAAAAVVAPVRNPPLSSDELIQKVLATKDDPYGTISLNPLGLKVTRASPLFDCRRAYMRLAQMIHPDRCKSNPKATEAFQALVQAFEYVANPDEQQVKKQEKDDEKEAKKEKAKKQKTTKKTAASTTKKRKPAETKKRSKKGADSDDDAYDENESSDEEEDSDDEEDEDANELLGVTNSTVPSKPVPRRPRVDPAQRKKKVEDLKKRNINCFRTAVACPKCKEGWLPDDNRLYTMFMSFGLKIHCQTCLFTFGAITAIHGCPCCRKLVYYDPSEYHKQVTCSHCKRDYGYTFYNVGDDVLENLRKQAKQQAELEAKKAERDKRAANQSDEDKTLELIGSCMVEEKCPICKKAVKSKHKAHVLNCIENPPAPKTRAGGGPALAAVVDGTTGRVVAGASTKKAPPPKPRGKVAGRVVAAPGSNSGGVATKKTVAPKKAPAKPAAKKKRGSAKKKTEKKTKRGKRGREDSDDDDSDDDESSSYSSSDESTDESSDYSSSLSSDDDSDSS